ncbi:DsbA family protein [Streptomyces sp. NPDC127110]|uniref:DsbA family protein n=1 Tax=Streptomyces sp. NPDC127110 TaxID=3345362 RepID=UPI0036327896
MRAEHRSKLAYAVVWVTIAAGAVVVVPRMLPDADVLERKPAGPAYAATAELPEVLLDDGTTIAVGDPEASTVVRLVEDPRCPVVADFEASGAKAIRAHTLQRRTLTEYTLASFKDGALGGDGSKRAVNALRAALDVQKFSELHGILLEHQEEVEASGGYTTERLLSLAEQVPGLRSEAFDAAVSGMKYEAFVTASQQAYEVLGGESTGPGTPTVAINSTMLDGEEHEAVFDEGETHDLLTAVERAPEALRRRR